MKPYERKLVHDAVAEVAGVETSSRGEEPNRYVVIRPQLNRPPLRSERVSRET